MYVHDHHGKVCIVVFDVRATALCDNQWATASGNDTIGLHCHQWISPIAAR